MTGSQPSLHRTPSERGETVADPSTVNDYDDDDEDEIDVESLRRIFGSFSPEDLKKRKPHELREQWMEAMQVQEQESTPTSTSTSTSTATSNTEKVQSSTKTKTKTRLPRFLLDPKDEQHVAPHAFALQLLLGHTHPGYRLRRSRSKSKTDGDGLYRKVATINSIDEDENNNNNDEVAGSSRVSHRRRRRRRRRRRVSRQKRDLPGPLAALLLASIASASLACQFVLEVLGGAGAIWGCAELVGWRTGGLGQPSGDHTQTIALGVGLVCFLRFVLTRFCGSGSASGSGSSPSVKDRCRRILRRNGNSTGWASMVLGLSRIASEDPVGFLHPSRGPVIASLCGECSGGNGDDDDDDDDDDIIYEDHDDNDDDDYGDDDDDDDDDDYGDEELGRPRHKSLAPSPPSLGGQRRTGNSTPSPQRKTWEMSSDDDYDDNDRAHGWGH